MKTTSRLATALGALALAFALAPTTANALTAPMTRSIATTPPAETTVTPTPVTTPTPEPPATPAPTPGAPVWSEVGRSVQDRPITMVSFGDGSNRVLILGGVHANEYGVSVARRLIEYLLANPWAVPEDTRIDVIAVANPDGLALRRQPNARRVDLNRNFPSSNWRRIKTRSSSSGASPGSEPETQALVNLMMSGGYSRVVSLHSRGGIIDYDGPGARSLATRFSHVSHWPVIRLARFKRYPGSLGSWAPETLGIPVLTVELADRRLTTHLRKGLLAVTR